MCVDVIWSKLGISTNEEEAELTGLELYCKPWFAFCVSGKYSWSSVEYDYNMRNLKLVCNAKKKIYKNTKIVV